MSRSGQQRIYLYVLRPDGEPGAFQWIAAANGFLPSLWQILLANGVHDAAPQAVVGGDASGWTTVDARAALLRYARFIAFIERHPQFDGVAGLDRYLRAAREYLAQAIADWQAPDRAAAVLCTNLTPLPATDPDALIPPQHLAQLDKFYAALQRIMRADDFAAVEQLLQFSTRNLRFTDWKAWSGMFGLAQFEPDYFSSAFRQPCAGEFVDHDYDELGSEPGLGNDCYRFKVADRWGVRRIEGEQASTVLLPEWDRVLRAGVGEQSLVWIKRGSRFGLAAIAGERAGCIVHPADLDEVNGFVDGVAIVRRGAAMGLLNVDGSWRLQPCMQEVHVFANGRAVIRAQNKFGFIDTTAAVVVEPGFDEADDFSAAGVARVRRGQCCGLIRGDGSFALPLQFLRIEWSEEFGGWMCQRHDGWLLARADGSVWIDSAWDAIDVFIRGHLIRVRRIDSYGLLHWNGARVLACEYQELSTRDTYGVGPTSAQGKKSQVRTLRLRRQPPHRFADERPVEVVARRDDRVGLLSASGAQLIPFEFSYIDALEPHFEGGLRLLKPELMRVLSVPGKAAPRVGVWDIEQRRCIVPCRYDFVWLSLFDAAGGYGFIVGNRNPKRGASSLGRYRVGLLNADGSVLVPQEYAWIGESTPLNRDDAMGDLRSTLYYCWSRGEPVRASPNETGPLVGLPPPQFGKAPPACGGTLAKAGTV